MERIKVFLGGYVNMTNAQNLNCLALSQHLDKSLFKVKTMVLYSGNLDIPNLDGVQYIKIIWPHRLSKYISYLRGIIWCDIAYLPKGEITGFNRFFIKILKKKSISTVEGIIDKELCPTEMRKKEILDNFKGFSRLYSITEFMKNYNWQHHNLATEDRILYLGTDVNQFLIDHKIDGITNILFIGNDLVRKGVSDFIHVAKLLRDIHFHIAGSGNGKIDITSLLESEEITNIHYHGSVNREQLTNLLLKVDLHFFPSRSEGFPKVILETACAGVPTMLYPDYGAAEWITNNENGYIVKNKEEALSRIKELLKDPAKLQTVSKNAIQLGKSFSWEIKIKDWEKVFMEIARN
jgi:glycosyltransferase involved in cell wall biosynthesis